MSNVYKIFEGARSSDMRLLIVSHTPHYRKGDTLVGWGPTIREIDHLTQIFDKVVHIAPLYEGSVPDSAIAYKSSRVELRAVPPAGGERFVDKLTILGRIPVYISTIVRELGRADMVHVRCPANISLLALLLLSAARRPRLRWMKYAGNWRPAGGEAWSYTLQRWWLGRGLAGGAVTVNGEWAGQPQHVHSFYNPCLTGGELAAGRAALAGKELSPPLRLIYVGRVETAKGAGRAIEVLARLRQRSVAATLDVVGDGPERTRFERLATELGVGDVSHFHGWVARPELSPLYARSHLIIMPTGSSEGWPKVLSEAMAYGVVPVAGRVSSIPQYLARWKVGRAHEPSDVEEFVGSVAWYASHPEEWKAESERGAEAAESFSYERYLLAVRRLIEMELSSPLVGASGLGCGKYEDTTTPHTE